MSKTYEATVTKHYEQVAEQHGLSEKSTMEDITTRRKEIEAITAVLDKVFRQSSHLLEIGCGSFSPLLRPPMPAQLTNVP
jgi:hypothetical protein